MAWNIFGVEIPDPMPYDWHEDDAERRRLEREALENYVPDDREMHKPHYEGQNVRGPFASRPGIVTNQEDTEREPPAVDEDDYLNQLMMAALMKGGKGGPHRPQRLLTAAKRGMRCQGRFRRPSFVA